MDRTGRARSLSLPLLTLLVVAACGGPSPRHAAAPPADTTWHDFTGSWTAAGQRHVLAMGPGRTAAVLSLSGSAMLAGPSRPGVGFRTDAVVLTDDATGGLGRAVWTDEHGDQVFSELSGGGPASDGRVHGAITGGTGRYADAKGEYDFAWQYLMQNEDGTVQGRTKDLRGRVRLGGGARP